MLSRKRSGYLAGATSPITDDQKVNISGLGLNVRGRFPILSGMNWLVGGSILAVCGVLLRRALQLDVAPGARGAGLRSLGEGREAIYQSVAQELQTQCLIMGITLNDAIDEKDAGHTDLAERLVGLCAAEWDRLTEGLGGLLKVVAHHMPVAHVAVPLRSVSAQRFKTRTMTDFFRMYELLDQLVFRSKMRFQLQVRLLRRANETLTGEFRRVFRYAERTGDHSVEYWNRLDLLFHDFDLLSKETLLAFRAFLACLPDSAVAPFAGELAVKFPRFDRISVA